MDCKWSNGTFCPWWHFRERGLRFGVLHYMKICAHNLETYL